MGMSLDECRYVGRVGLGFLGSYFSLAAVVAGESTFLWQPKTDWVIRRALLSVCGDNNKITK